MTEYLEIAPEGLGRIGQSMVPCENCATQVSVVTVNCFPDQKGITRLMEAWVDESDPLMIHLSQHTPERCRTFRKERIDALIGEVTK